MRTILFMCLIFFSISASAEKLTCRQDDDTREMVCYNPLKLRGNGDLRAFTIFTGGPNKMTPNANLSIVNCKIGYMELRDRSGVVFARNQPSKVHIVQIRDDVCAQDKYKKDKALD